ncbi:aminotransferase class I/II-fold pyridoxal phosphate-dependent enzyme [Sinomicrobium weinanense]|uniref:Aminotransferase class I/II-fold pyridoxal phosphate-dependent enzyme n=1 Tax=Sinomicrobium weinanense TaxID=2842200 RepID=A0A926JP41_9FLAO|nr:aminotransferase class I/II-fold pyridoxal phosphate-dependent enzyme [Sinomicrobium weinanense]MBC9794718.1 aminotransferase class I/II-fold pyridoxal phosphate-dependent enzyme [Sinomicrobium weinanense]MBU3124977.1 aminotransferase class I/II-fold pyridoxal phosphate-dependent enzyme [Sinomicrobium weinanense]
MIHSTDSFPGRTVNNNGKNHLYFGGTAYLGLPTLPGFCDILISNILKYGTGYAASRKANVRLSIYEEAETIMAGLIGSEAALSVSSGFLAGQLTLQSFSEEEYTFFHAPGTHPALIHPGGRPYATHGQLLQDVRDFAGSHPDKTPVVLCDSVTPEQNLYENHWYEQLPAEQTIFIADDSHGLGIMGNKGEGVYKRLEQIPFKELVVCGSMSKGFGIQAGAIFSSGAVIRRLWDNPVFAGASPASPAMLATFRDALPVYDIQRKKLQDNLKDFERYISGTDIFNGIKGHPAYSYKEESLTRYLLDKGIITTAFPYPDARSSLVQRIVISAYHTREDISKLCSAVRHFIN